MIASRPNWPHRRKNFVLRGRNNGFICAKCQRQVGPHSVSARNHCPYCLTSKHVDDKLPGDRLNPCGGLMPTVTVEKHSKAGYRLIQKCQKCGHKRANLMAPDDDFDKIIKIVSL